jgi:hypothetical protein
MTESIDVLAERDPVLAAARLGILPAGAYDAAYDAIEAQSPGRYRPAPEVEAFLRANWARMLGADEPVPKIETPSVAELSLARGQSTAEADRLLETFPMLHWQACCEILSKDAEYIRPVPNVLQQRMDQAYIACVYVLAIACRMLVLKPRQVGCTTFAAYLCYHHARRVPGNLLMMADVNKRTDKLWDIFNGYSQRDVYPWKSKYLYNTERATMSHPGGVVVEVERDTAMDSKSGRAGTRNAIHYSEVAHYARDGAAQDSKLIAGSLNSLVKGNNSLAIAETTANGSGGWFFSSWQGAVTVQQMAAGERGNGWIKVFAAWYEFTIRMLSGQKPALTKEELAIVRDSPDDVEKRLIALHGNEGPQGFRLGTTNAEDTAWEQLAWRRRVIHGEFGGDARTFAQEFPADPEEAFLSSGSPRFDSAGVTRIELLARHDTAGRRGRLEEQAGRLMWIDGQEGAWLWVYERPTSGHCYLGWLDPMTGEQSEGSVDSDCHTFGVWRRGYMDSTAQYAPTELACAIDVPGGCRWKDADVLAARIARVLRWYGDCMIVPEVNVALDIVAELRRLGCTIYHREKFDEINPGKKLQVMGWKTTAGAGGTRRIVVNAMAVAIREGTVNIRYKPFAAELRTFITDKYGVDCAKGGFHDDWIFGGGIGLACLDFAKAYASSGQIRESRRKLGANS